MKMSASKIATGFIERDLLKKKLTLGKKIKLKDGFVVIEKMDGDNVECLVFSDKSGYVRKKVCVDTVIDAIQFNII